MQEHGPEFDAWNQGYWDGREGKPKRVLKGYLAEYQAKYNEAYEKALKK